MSAPLTLIRGFVTVEYASPSALKVNGVAVNATSPAELALIPGLHRFSAELGTTRVERTFTVGPGAHLRLQLKP